MEDLSLADLLQDLEDVQTRKTTVRLSERNVVELVIKLKAMGLLRQELLHTANGREYVTRSALVNEVRALVGARHRIPMVDLPAALGVDLVHCREAAETLAGQGKPCPGGTGVLLAQDELFAPAFFDDLAEEVEELLRDQDAASMGDLAQRFGLGAALLTSALERRCGAGMAAHLEGGYLYTDGFTRRLKASLRQAQLRGALRGAVAPVNVPALVAALGMGGATLTQAIVPPILDQLQSEGGIAGTLAAGSTWVPAAHEAAQMDQGRQFFSQNAYIDWTTAKRWVPRGTKEWCVREFADAVLLRDCLVSRSVVAQLEAALDDVEAEGSWVDARALLPPGMPEDDARTLVQKSLGSRTGLSVPCGCFVVSERLQRDLAAAAERAGREAESRGAAEAAAAAPVAGAEAQAADKPGIKAAQRGGRGGRAPAGSGSVDSSAIGKNGDEGDDDDWATSAAKRKGGKKPGRKGPSQKATSAATGSVPGREKDAAAAITGGKRPPSHQGAAPLLKTESEAVLAELRPDVAEEPELAAALLPGLARAARAAYDAARASRRASGAERRRLLREAHAVELQMAYELLQTQAAGAAALLSNAEPAAREAAARHALRTLGCAAADAALRHAAVDGLTEEEAETDCAALSAGGVVVGEQGGAPVMPSVVSAATVAGNSGDSAQRYPFPALTPAERGRLAGTQGPTAATLTQSADAGGDVEEFLHTLEAFAEKEGLRLRAPSKRQEKEILAGHIAELENRLTNTPPADGPAVLALAVPLLAGREAGRCVNLPGRALGPAVAALAAAVSPEFAEKLGDLHAAVLAHLMGQGGEDMAALSTQIYAMLLEGH